MDARPRERRFVIGARSRLAKRIDVYPFNSPWVARVISRTWLPLWFASLSIQGVWLALHDMSYIFFDARLYLDATRTWLAGGDPWSVQLAGFYFAAPPPTLIPLVPLAVLPPAVGVAALTALVILGAVATIRMLRLPWWWILFPPLVQCILSANVQALLIPLILGGGGALAAMLKVYAGLPLLLLGRWRALAGAGFLIVVTWPFLPWAAFIDGFPEITARLAEQTKYGLPTALALLRVPLALVLLALVGRERAAWLSVSALWPSQQYYYGTLAMGTRSSLVGALIALPIPGSGLVALFGLAVAEWWRRHARSSVAVRLPSGPSAR